MGNDPLDRVDRLERDLARLQLEVSELRARLARTERAAAPATQWAPPVATPPSHEPASWPNPAQLAQPKPARPILLESETILKWGGIGLVVLAVGFAVSTAISRGWIGPELQLAGALLVSFGLIGAGLRLRATRPPWTHALCSGGVLALFTTFASTLFLDQASDDVAFMATAASGLAGIALTWAIRSEWTGAATLLGGAVGWMVIADGELPMALSAAWFGVSVALGLIVALDRKMAALRFLAHVAGLLLVLPLAEAADHRSEQIAALAIAALLFGSMTRLPSIGDLTSIWQQLEIQLTIATGPWAFGVISITFELESDLSLGCVAIGVAVGTAIVALAVKRSIHESHFVSLLIGASVALTIGVAVLLSTTAAFMAIAVQGAGLVVLSRSFDREIRVLVNAAGLVIVAATFALGNMIEAWTDDAPVGDDIAHATIIAALAVAAWLTGLRQVQQIAAAATLALTLVWLGSVLVHLPQGQAVVSVSWAVIGIGVLIAGAIRKMPEVGAAGLAVIGITVGKLLTVDLQEVDTLWRAGLFLVIGLGIMRIGFLLPRFAPGDDAADEPTTE